MPFPFRRGPKREHVEHIGAPTARELRQHWRVTERGRVERDPNADPNGPRPNRPVGHHCKFATDGDGNPILTNWADCTCVAGADHT